jgi:hypothetical protein
MAVARLAPVEPTEWVVELVSELFERSERTDEDVPEFEFDDEDFPGNTKKGHFLSAEYSKQLRKLSKLTGFEKFPPEIFVAPSKLWRGYGDQFRNARPTTESQKTWGIDQAL